VALDGSVTESSPGHIGATNPTWPRWPNRLTITRSPTTWPAR